jgi:hypothetical protein
MALNPNIILSGQQLDVLGPIQQGLRSREQFDQAPFRNQLLEQGVQQGQQRVDINEQTIRKQALEQQLFGARKAISAHDEQGEFGGPNAAGVIDGIREGFKGDEDRVKAEILEYQQDPFAYISNAKNEVDAYDSQQRGGQRQGTTQFGSQSTFKDSEGNLFFGTTKRNPNTGEVESVLASIDGSDSKPVGKIQETGSFGLTSEEASAKKVGEAVSSERGKLGEQLKAEPKIAATTDAAKAAIKLSTDTFKRLEPIQTNIANIDEAISLIDQGAETGPIISRLPSIRSSSVQLDTLQKKLGLDVISSTTFGALSEGEREFALSTALPKNLAGPDLKKWLQRKKDTQKKLADQLGEAATFLGTPGNTIADYIEIKKVENLEEQEAATAPQSSVNEGATATNPQTGQKAVFTNGQWQPI